MIPRAEFNQRLGSMIKAARRNAGIKRINVPRLFGFSSQQLSKYENGENSLSVYKMLQIFKLLKLPLLKTLENALKEKLEEDMSNYPEGMRSRHRFYDQIECKICGNRWQAQKETDLGMTYFVHDWDAQCPECKKWNEDE